MNTFKDILSRLPSVEKIAALELYTGTQTEPAAVIENKPGQSGALAVYYKISLDFGGIGPSAAKQGLQLFAEHTLHAHDHPGAHPNIDRLFRIIEEDTYYATKVLYKK